mgnify:CR=1 FL=1
MKVSPNSPWFDHDYLNLRKKRRAAEKKYQKTKSENDKKTFIDLRKETTKLAFTKNISITLTKLAVILQQKVSLNVLMNLQIIQSHLHCLHILHLLSSLIVSTLFSRIKSVK